MNFGQLQSNAHPEHASIPTNYSYAKITTKLYAI